MEPVCAWKSLEMDFRLFLLFDPCLRNEDVLFGEAGRTFLKLENSFEVV